MEKLSELSKPVRIYRAWNRASMCHCGKCDRWEMTIADADGVQTCASCYDAEWLSEWQNYAEAAEKHITELEAIKADASQVFREIGNELGCNPDNESIMMTIDDLKATQMTGPLKDVLKRNIELEAKLATPVRLPETYSPEPWMGPDPSGTWLEKEDVKDSIRTAGFKVAGDEQ